MHQISSSLAKACETLNYRIGCAISWLTLGTVLLMFANVVLRYAFNAGAPWQIEVVLALHAATFLTTMGYTLQAGEQVRVDVLYSRFPQRKKAWVDLLGMCFFLTPLCIALMVFSWSFVSSSWALQEASSEYNGMYGIFLLKTFLLIGPALLLLQGFATAIRSVEVLRKKESLHG